MNTCIRCFVATVMGGWVAAVNCAPNTDVNTTDRLASFVATRDAVLTVETNRQKIVARLVQQHRDGLSKHGIAVDAFAAALQELPAERLLAASLADSI